jgi:hypothetical protein
MYVIDSLQLLLRRWYVVVIGVVLVAAAAFGVLNVVPTEYEGSATVVFVIPVGPKDALNPYLNLQQGQFAVASLIGSMVSTDEAQKKMAETHTSEYTVGQAPGSTVPQLLVTSKGKDAKDVVSTVNEVVREIESDLERIQTEVNAPAAQIIQARVFNMTQVAEPVRGAKVRAIAVVGVVGLALTLLVAFGLDRLLMRGRQGSRRKGPRSLTAAPEPIRSVATVRRQRPDARRRNLTESRRSVGLEDGDLDRDDDTPEGRPTGTMGAHF